MNAQNSILGLLQLGPNYGYELKKMYDQLFGREKPILPGQIYSTLSRLQRDGKVEIVPVKSTETISSGPERVQYQITHSGSEYFQKWLAEPESVNPNLQVALYQKVVLALLSDADANSFLDKQYHYHIERMRELTNLRLTSDLATTLLIDNAIYHIEADLRWIEMTSQRISQLKEEICQSKNS